VPRKIRAAKPQSYHHGDLRRALIETTLELVTEEQDWAFSLREVACRAGVSHRLMFGPALSAAGSAARPTIAKSGWRRGQSGAGRSHLAGSPFRGFRRSTR
jgi:hypothetical protein